MAMRRVVCPKPRRVAPLRFHMRDDADSKSDAELLGLILRKDDFKAEKCSTLPSSPPSSFGSPPCRTPNPVVQDANFGAEKLCFTCEVTPNSASQQSAHAREQLRVKQATVRVVGFDCGYCHRTESVDCI